MNLLALYACCFLFAGTNEPTATLQVQITNVKNGNGKIWIALFRPDEKFGTNKPGIAKIISVTSADDQTATFELAPGRYALAMYHDLNGNDLMDRNFVGIPKEPYGFSKNFRPRFSAPSFEDCAFELLPGGKTISVKLTN
ncbi:DUF2141 domain-containing protein [Dyadobacter sp. NIV53]|uniref:DUF2141 domain-containing protein n=1 Tax=Dyadobacter sp. NIV53 TaxID=2861765 RepID=UPI001C88E242|nr:DUF2141 domain-containing protein [Dyadobacter sp. NIV53]